MVKGEGGEWLFCHLRLLELEVLASHVQKDSVEEKQTDILNIT